MRIAIIAWNGDPKQGFYAVPKDKAQKFLDTYNSPGSLAAGHWQEWKPEVGPCHFLPME